MTNGRAGGVGNRVRWLLALPALAALLASTAGCMVGAPTAAAPSSWAPAPAASAPAEPATPSAPRPERAVRAPDSVGPLSRAAEGRPAAKVPVRGAALPDARQARGAVPAEITIDDLGISLPIRPVGVAEDGSMELPETVSQAGWYEFGARPADRGGITVLAAHVDTREEGLGQFARLREAREGSIVMVTDRGGDRYEYRVVQVTRIAKSKVPWDGIFDRAGPSRLAIVTCGGEYDRDRGSYRDNVIVLAEAT